MPVEWRFPEGVIRLGGMSEQKTIEEEVATRQETTARAIVDDLGRRPGVVLADEVGMGKTFVALAVMASVIDSAGAAAGPVVVMVPPGLLSKWMRDWDLFRTQCVVSGKLRTVRDETARNGTEFFKLLDDGAGKRPGIIWMPTNAFSQKLSDGWVKLGLVRLARRRTKMDDEMKRRLYKWAPDLVRLKKHKKLTPEVVERLLNTDLDRWCDLLVNEGLLDEGADDPVPQHLSETADHLDFGDLNAVLRGEEIPGRRGRPSDARRKEARFQLNEACQALFEDWLRKVRWRSPLLVMDEAHHAKNDETRLSSLFRSEETTRLVAVDSESGTHPILWEKFDRMLFLTATPFQLGHHELVRVLRSFAAVRWKGRNAPERTREEFFGSMNELERKLDRSRLSGRALDRLWGRLDLGGIGLGGDGDEPESAARRWWERVEGGERTSLDEEVVWAVKDAREKKLAAEGGDDDDWSTLRPWVVRHNRPTLMRPRNGQAATRRRDTRHGRAIATGTETGPAMGLPIEGEGALPFLLAARAQGELAHGSARTRAFFAEGLCSSYEAFHHTRKVGGEARDVDDDGLAPSRGSARGRPGSLVPVAWYEDHIGRCIPDRASRPAERLAHPKLGAVVKQVVDLWRSGEKVLVFCVYRETAKALREHVRREVDEAVLKMAAVKLGTPRASARRIDLQLVGIARRLGTGAFRDTIERLLREPLAEEPFAPLRGFEDRIVGLLSAYVRSPSFIARYLPIDDPDVRRALRKGNREPEVIRAGLAALEEALTTREDASRTTMMSRVREFLAFATELAERRSQPTGEDEGDSAERDPLEEYLKAVAVFTGSRNEKEDDDEEMDAGSVREGSYRAVPMVRMVFGDTKPDARNRLMLAFNSPLFPEILISSAVLGEGVDLHRFCRYVIHHDLCWNPSTLEQRTGRLDRIRCKAEVTGHPIVVYEPFLAGSADEKMFRVVKDRERWFQIVMGQKYEFDEGTSEELSRRVPLPEKVARELMFDLRRYRGDKG